MHGPAALAQRGCRQGNSFSLRSQQITARAEVRNSARLAQTDDQNSQAELQLVDAHLKATSGCGTRLQEHRAPDVRMCSMVSSGKWDSPGVGAVWELCGSSSDSEINVRVEDEITGLAHYAVKAKDPMERLEGLEQNNMADLGKTGRMRQRQGAFNTNWSVERTPKHM